jgi:hypothetical protein
MLSVVLTGVEALARLDTASRCPTTEVSNYNVDLRLWLVEVLCHRSDDRGIR